MEPPITLAFERLERRLALMRQLATSLEQGQAAILTMDLERIERQTLEQQTVCERLRALDEPQQASKRLPPIQECAPTPTHFPFPADVVSAEIQQRWIGLLQECAGLQGRVRHLNRVHAALLRRAQRSIAVLANVLASSAATYAPPNFESDAVPALESRK